MQIYFLLFVPFILIEYLNHLSIINIFIQIVVVDVVYWNMLVFRIIFKYQNDEDIFIKMVTLYICYQSPMRNNALIVFSTKRKKH